jgi:hypothetical protein
VIFKNLFRRKKPLPISESGAWQAFHDYLEELEKPKSELDDFWPIMEAKLCWDNADKNIFDNLKLNEKDTDQYDQLMWTEFDQEKLYLLCSRATYFPDIAFIPQYRLIRLDEKLQNIKTIGHLDKMPENWSLSWQHQKVDNAPNN